jgi:hypothetical protein
LFAVCPIGAKAGCLFQRRTVLVPQTACVVGCVCVCVCVCVGGVEWPNENVSDNGIIQSDFSVLLYLTNPPPHSQLSKLGVPLKRSNSQGSSTNDSEQELK